MALSCRYYANEFPEVEDVVMVKVHKIAEMGAYAYLCEYNNKEGLILLSELSRRRIRSVNKLIRIGRMECVAVLRVDEKKSYIDLSKRRVYAKDLIACEDRYARAKAINSILRHVADQLGYKKNEQLEELYEKTAWHFDRKLKKKAGAYEIFKKALTDPSVFDECNISAKVKEKLLEDIKKKLTPQALKIRADIEVSCFSYEGVEAVKSALGEGKKCSTEEMPIKINLIAAPQFVVTATAQTMERADGIDAVERALEAVKTSIESFGGTFKILNAPKVVTDIDEVDMKKRLELLENEEDESDSGEDDEGLVAPKGLDEAADEEEARNVVKQAGKQEDEGEGEGEK